MFHERFFFTLKSKESPSTEVQLQDKGITERAAEAGVVTIWLLAEMEIVVSINIFLVIIFLSVNCFPHPTIYYKLC